MNKFKLVNLETGKEWFVEEMEGKKYAMKIPVDNIAPADISVYMTRCADTCDPFFGKGNCLYIPIQKNQPQIEIFKVE